MKIELAIFEIALKKHALLSLVFAYVAFQILPLLVQTPSNLLVIFVVVPNFWHPIDTSGVRPPEIVLCDQPL